jgi:Zn-finger nucleic acid-binding protein
MQCPKCLSETMVSFTVGDVAIERCSLCDGTWFDEYELSRLLAEEARNVARLRKGAIDPDLDAIKALCPRDGAPLLRMYSAIDKSVVLDACADCHGIWLDGGEFAKLYNAQRQQTSD